MICLTFSDTKTEAYKNFTICSKTQLNGGAVCEVWWSKSKAHGPSQSPASSNPFFQINSRRTEESIKISNHIKSPKSKIV